MHFQYFKKYKFDYELSLAIDSCIPYVFYMPYVVLICILYL